MPGGRRWSWKQLPVDRLHVLTLSSAVRITCAMRDRLPTPMAAAVESSSFSVLASAACSATRRARRDGAQAKPAAQANSGYKPPALAVPDTMRPFLEQVQPGKDAFPLEGQAAELEARLGELSEGLRGGRARVAAVLTSLLAQEFRGAPLLPADEPASNESPFQVQRAAALPRRRDARRSRLRRRSPASHSRPAGHHRRGVPDHLARCRWHGRPAGAAPHDGPLRPGRQRHDDASCRARRRVGADLAADRIPVADRPLDRALPRRQPRETAGLHGNHRRGARRQRVVPASARHRPRHLDGDDRLGADP